MKFILALCLFGSALVFADEPPLNPPDVCPNSPGCLGYTDPNVPGSSGAYHYCYAADRRGQTFGSSYFPSKNEAAKSALSICSQATRQTCRITACYSH